MGGVGGAAAPVSGNGPPGATTLRRVQVPTICRASHCLVEDLPNVEGSTQVQYVKKDGIRETEAALASGDADINMLVAPLVLRIDAGDPVTALAGGRIGCYGLFGTGPIQGGSLWGTELRTRLPEVGRGG
jgi:hypothetical protein